MNQLFIDTNIIIDLLSRREPFYEEAAILFSLADKQEIKISTSSLSFANTNFVLRKVISSEGSKEILRIFKLLITTLSLTEKIVDLALNDSTFKDFEDSLEYFTALENKIEIIITRDLKDFKKSKLPIMTAKQFLIKKAID